MKWPGFCIVHEQFTERQLHKLKARHPQALLIAHPECEASVLAMADFVGSTRGLLEYVKASPAKSFIVATEVGILHLMSKARPDAELIPARERQVTAQSHKNTVLVAALIGLILGILGALLWDRVMPARNGS